MVVTGIVLVVTQPWSFGGGSGDGGSGSGDLGTTTGGTGWDEEAIIGIGDTSTVDGTVPANALDYTDTGLYCRDGGRLDITASGEITASESGETVGPDGLTNGESPDVRILTDAPTAALIGKLADTSEPPFLIGDKKSYPCPTYGRLYLGINDTSAADNSGKFDVIVTFVPAQ